ncbi:MAG: peptidase [Acidobacteriota bacterium]
MTWSSSSSRLISAALGAALVLAGTFALAGPAFAAGPSPLAGLERIPAGEAPALEPQGSRILERSSGVVAWLDTSGLGVSVPAGQLREQPDAAARGALESLRGALGLGDSLELVHHATRVGPSATVVRLRQQVDGVPVYGAELVVAITARGRVSSVTSTYAPNAQAAPAVAAISSDAALDAARAYFAATPDFANETLSEPSLVIYTDSGFPRLAWRTLTEGYGLTGDWELLVDASTGEVFRVDDRKVYVDGTGVVFTPDPLSSATATYGDPGFVDGSDADTPQLAGETQVVTLHDITENAGTFSLTGPWAEVTDHDSPFKGLFTQASSDWTGNRTDDSFEAANGYFHIDAYMRYLNDTLGINVRPYQYATGVRFDPSGAGGADNSFYSTGTGRLTFGEGGVDDAEDADVLIHELGHGLHDWITSGGLSQAQGLSEGVGDFAAVSYSRGFPGQWTDVDPQFNWVFSWDGHNPFWNGRRTDWNDTRDYPGDLVGQIHTDGQFWASCNIDIVEAIGRDAGETAHWEGLARTGGGTNQEAAAQAVLDAAADLGFSASDVMTMWTIYDGCGYTVTMPDISSIFIDGFESGDLTMWSSSVP